MNVQTQQFITLHADDDIQSLALQRSRFLSTYPELDWDFALQQIEGHQLMQRKLPTISTINGWLYPKRLSLEQCSSEITAQYKLELLPHAHLTIADLTGGFGIDAFYLSQCGTVDYVEQDPELCRIAAHNFSLTNRPIRVHNITAESFLQAIPHTQAAAFQIIYLDPARRNRAGQKLFRLEDCSPNVLTLIPLLRQCSERVLLKLSPMIDLNLLLCQLQNVAELHVVAIQNEVKEVLVLLDFTQSQYTRIVCQNILRTTRQTFIFTPEEEKECPYPLVGIENILLEPNAAILKAGAFKTIATRFNLQKLDPNTHLYTAKTFPEAFPGRCFQILATLTKADLKALKGKHLNVITRNYPIAADKLQHQLGIISGGVDYLIGARVHGKPHLWLARII